MALSRVYPTTQAFALIGAPYPYGASSLLAALDEGSDGFIVFPPPESGSTPYISFSFNYDSNIPTGASITSIANTFRFAQTGSLVPQADVSSGIVDWGESLPQASTFVTGKFPEDADFDTATITFDEPGLFPLTVPNFVSALETSGVRAQVLGGYWDGAERLFLDAAETEIFFTLPTITTIFATSTLRAERNRIRVQAILVAEAGTTNTNYPITAWFEYTQMDPSVDGFDDLVLGQGKVVAFGKQSVVDTGDPDPAPGARTGVQIIGDTGRVLIPGTTYYVRAVAQTADTSVDPVAGAWGAVTTPLFDAPTSL